MRTTALSVIVIATAIAGFALPAAALDLDGFLERKSEGHLAISFTDESYDEFWIGEQTAADPALGEVTTRSVSLWLSYGLTDDATLFVTLPYVDADGDGTGELDAGELQDLSLAAAYRLLGRGTAPRHELIGALGVRTPASNYEPDGPVAVGDGTTDWLVRLVYQLRFRGWYVSQQLGFDLRGEDAPDGYPLVTTLGYTRGPLTYSAFYSMYIAPDGSDIGDPGFTFPGLREEYTRAGIKLYGRLNQRFGLSVSAFEVLDGRNTGESSGVSAGVVLGF